MVYQSALDLGRAIKKKEISVIDAVASCYDRIGQGDNRHNAFISLCKDEAMTRAVKVQSQIDSGAQLSPLAGVPIGIKDNISTVGMETTCASAMLRSYKPVFNATVVEKLEKAGMIIIGKLNMDEFAMGGSSETGIFGAVKNPWDTSRVAGGSSGGSAAAVAAMEVPLTLGSDTGGSIRQPCAFCGTTGIKPTYGSVSRYGLIAFASSLDQIGPIARNIDDCAALLSVISGPDVKDSTNIIERPFNFDNNGKYKDLRIALPRNYLGDGVDDDVKNTVLAAAKQLEDAGVLVEEIEMPLLDYMIHAYYIISCAEASSNLSRYDGLKYGHRSSNAQTLQELYRNSRNEGFGFEVKKRIMIGSFVLSSGYIDAYYKKALKLRSMIKDAFDDIFKRFDAVISPVAPTAAYKIGQNAGDAMKMYMGDIFTVSVNLAGLPAVALPCGFTSGGMPTGMQLIGEAFSEGKLVEIARIYQKCTDFHEAMPSKAGSDYTLEVKGVVL